MCDELIFKAFLTPHRSLGRRGFMIFAILISVLMLGHIFIFIVMNAWPVTLFLGLDLCLVFGAFWLNYRSGHECEEIFVSRFELKIRKIMSSSKCYEKSLNPLWVKFHVDRHEYIGITNMKIYTREDEISIGAMLNPDDKESFSRVFSHALAKAKYY